MKFGDLVYETTATAGTGAFTLAGRKSADFRTFDEAFAIGDQMGYRVRGENGQYEIGVGTLTAATTLARTQVLVSSNANALVNFAAGAKDIYETVPADILADFARLSEGIEVSDLPEASGMLDTDYETIFRPGVGEMKILASTVKAYHSGDSTPPATPIVSTVSVAPSTANIAGGATQQFTATVTGTNSPSQAVTWTASAGTITSGGLFTAPTATSSAQTITITARSTLDNTKSGTATVTVAAAAGAPTPTVSSVTVTPSTANVAGGATQQFTGTVTGTNSPAQTVNWTASAGTINSAGLFTAPAATSSAQTITVTATSTQDATKSGTATVTVAASAGTGATYTYSRVDGGSPNKAGLAINRSTTHVVNSGYLGFFPPVLIEGAADSPLWGVSPVPNPDEVFMGFGTSNTSPPARVPVGTSATSSQNRQPGGRSMKATGGSTFTNGRYYYHTGYMWAPDVPGVQYWYLWIDVPGGVPFCVNPNAPIVLTL